MLKAKVTVSLKLACGCSYRGTEPISVFEATHPGVSRVCPKHETSQVVTEVRTKLYERTS